MNESQDLHAGLWADWVTIWQSEMAATATDREVQEGVQRAADLWAAQALALGQHDAPGSAGAAAPTGPAPALAPSDRRHESAPDRVRLDEPRRV